MQAISRKILSKIFIVLIYMGIQLLLITSFSYGDTQEFEASSDTIHTKIGVGKQNRIEIEQSVIMEVIGNANQFDLITNQGSSYFFITPKLKEGSKIELSVVYGDDHVSQLMLEVATIPSQTILIKSSTDKKIIKNTKPQELMGELSDIIRHMVLSKKGKYFIEHIGYALPQVKESNLRMTFDTKYNYEQAELIGRRIKIKNLGRNFLNITESDFEHLFEDIIAINISKTVLKAREEGHVYLVSKVSHWNRE